MRLWCSCARLVCARQTTLIPKSWVLSLSCVLLALLVKRRTWLHLRAICIRLRGKVLRLVLFLSFAHSAGVIFLIISITPLLHMEAVWVADAVVRGYRLFGGGGAGCIQHPLKRRKGRV